MSFYRENSFGPSNDMEVDNLFENGNNISFEDQMNMDNIIPSNINSKNIEYNDSIIFLDQEALQSNPDLINFKDYNNNNPNSINSFKQPVNFDDGFFHSNNLAFTKSNLNNLENAINKNYNHNNSNSIRLLNLKKQLVLEQMNFKISRLFSVIQKYLDILKYKSFLCLKDYLKKRRLNLLKAESIFSKFQSLMVNISKIYVKFQKLKFSKFFLKWKNYIFFRKRYNQLKSDIEKNSEKKYDKELKSLEAKIREKEEENSEAKKTLQKNSEIEAGILKSISEFEEKENNYIKGIKKLEHEKEVIQEEIESIILESTQIQSILKNINHALVIDKGDGFNANNSKIFSTNAIDYMQKFSTDNSGNNSNGSANKNVNNNVNSNDNSGFAFKKGYMQKLQEMIKQKEAKIRRLRQENSDKDKKINVFMNEMAELIQVHENNIDIVFNLGNLNQNYSVNYNNIENYSLEENKSNINSFAKSTSKPTIKLNQNPALSNKLLYSSNNPLNKSNLFNSGAILNTLAIQPHSVRNSNTKSNINKLGYFPNYAMNVNNNDNNNNGSSEFNSQNNQNKVGILNSKVINYSKSFNINEAISGYNTNASTNKQTNSFGLNMSNSNLNSNLKDGLNINNNNSGYNTKIMRK